MNTVISHIDMGCLVTLPHAATHHSHHHRVPEGARPLGRCHVIRCNSLLYRCGARETRLSTT